LEDDCVDKLEIFLVWHLVSKLRILSQYISSQIVVAELAVQEKQIAEGLRQEGRVFKQEVKLFE
jgi:hypothetical protein